MSYAAWAAHYATQNAKTLGRIEPNVTNQGEATRKAVVGQAGETRDLINRRMEGFDSTAQDLRKGQSDISRDIYEQGLDNRLEFDSLRGFIGDQTNQLGSQFSGINQNINDVYQQGANIGSTLDYEFANLSDNMTGVNNNLSNLGNTVGQEFSNLSNQVGTGFSDLNTSMNDGLMAASDERQAGFTGLSDQVGTGFAGQADYLNTMSSNILGGQQDLNQRLEDTGNRLDTYYGGLSQGQAGLMDQVGGVQTGLTDLSQEYEDDVALANQDRANIQRGIENTRNTISEDVGRMASAQNAAQEGLMRAVGGVQNTAESTAEELSATRGDMNRGMSAQNSAVEQQRLDFTNRIKQVRDLLEVTGETLDNQTRQQYSELVAAFDENGDLIERSFDEQGLMVSRQFDGQNNLIISKFNQSGDQVDNLQLNIDRTLSQAEMFEQAMLDRAPGINANMSRLTQPQRRQDLPVEQGGLMTPYTQTR